MRHIGFTLQNLKTNLLILLLTFTMVGMPVLTRAVSEQELRDRQDQLSQQISSSKATLKKLAGQKNTLENRIASINTEVKTLQSEIELTDLQIGETEDKLAQTKKDLARQKKIMQENARTLYKTGDPSAIEVLFASNNFSEFVNKQEYLKRVRESVNEAARQVEKLRNELNAEKTRLLDLADQQEVQKTALLAKKDEQKQLLEETKGQEVVYQDKLEEQHHAMEETDAQLTAFLAKQAELARQAEAERQRQAELEQQRQAAAAAASQSSSRSAPQPKPAPTPKPRPSPSANTLVTSGFVRAGQRIGSVGSTGYSTGPHLHFEVRNSAGVSVHPGSASGLINGYRWPIAGGGGYVSQGYGCSSIPYATFGAGCPGHAPYQHTGIDIVASAGTPVIAAADGQIIYRGWYGGYGNTVMIRHSNGYFTMYPHML